MLRFCPTWQWIFSPLTIPTNIKYQVPCGWIKANQENRLVLRGSMEPPTVWNPSKNWRVSIRPLYKKLSLKEKHKTVSYMTAPIATCMFSSLVPFLFAREPAWGAEAVVSRLAERSTTPSRAWSWKISLAILYASSVASSTRRCSKCNWLMEYSSMLWHCSNGVEQPDSTGQELRRICLKLPPMPLPPNELPWFMLYGQTIQTISVQFDFIAFVRICSPTTNHNKYHFWTNIWRSRNPNPSPLAIKNKSPDFASLLPFAEPLMWLLVEVTFLLFLEKEHVEIHGKSMQIKVGLS